MFCGHTVHISSVFSKDTTMIACAVLIVAVILFVAYLTGKYNELYWRKRKVAFYTKHKVIGVFWKFIFENKSVVENLREVYNKYRNEPAIGMGAFLTPTLYVTDPSNMQHVFATDFTAFNHRGFDTNKSDRLSDNIVFMTGSRWKLVRQSMTPLFTAVKLKSMYYIIDRSATDFVEHLKKDKGLWKGDTYDTVSSFCCAAIGGAVFGLSADSIFDSPFLNMTRNAFKPDFKTNVKFAIANLSNTLFNILGINLFKEHEHFFINTMEKVLREREKDQGRRHDFPDICLALKSMGNMVDKQTGTDVAPTDELFAAQAFIFYVAGVEPTANAIFSTLVELGRHPEYLNKVHREIDEMFESQSDKISYDAVMTLKYLDMAVSEALRMYPPIGYLTRKCLKDSILPVGNIRVDKGTKVLAPIFEIHHDDRFYPEPEKFIPERFSPENKHNISDGTYTPFGRGSRACIGARYALLQVKAGLVHLLREFTVTTAERQGGLKFTTHPVQVRLENVNVEFVPRNIASDSTQYLPFYGGAKGQYLEIRKDTSGSVLSEKIVPEESISSENILKNREDNVQSKVFATNLSQLKSLSASLSRLLNLGRRLGYLSTNDKEKFQTQLASLGESASNTIKIVDEIGDDVDALFRKNKPDTSSARKYGDNYDDDVGDEGISIGAADEPGGGDPLDGTTIAEAKPVGLAVIGESGLAASRPVATAVAASGVALARPIATAIAGLDPTLLGIDFQHNHYQKSSVVKGRARV